MQYSCTLCVERTIGLEISLYAPDGTPRQRGSCGILFHPLEIVLVSMEDRCAVCAKRTIGLEIFWTHLMELLGDEGHVNSHFCLFGDSAGVDAI